MLALAKMKIERRLPTNAQATPLGQRGGFLLEALIADRIVAFGVLGVIGQQARAIQNVDDAQYRAEAAFLANSLLGQMWVYDPKQLKADFSTGGGAPYVEFKNWVGQRLPGASIAANAPQVTIDAAANPAPLTATSHNVLIQVFWQAPGEPAGTPKHKYEIDATVGAN